ncbi:hypothetical protein RFH42_13955 [Acinetobacter rudis]|uniref:hypothetical protein n=1 Tax=Acinetobacter rudis TaxID=632955 RepID=UPI0028101864|nr:hypothetical protein [Acinetobacter rudis]MDQ8954053.1 hypothetical protein [Acinetobacter rudis]
MFSTHFNKQVFINSLKTNQNMMTFLSTTIGLIVTMFIHGLIQGQLKPVYFIYAIVVSLAFVLWAIIDQRFRPCHQDVD